MDVIYWLIPSMIFVGIVLVILLAIGVKSGQYDDLEGEGQRILFDDNEVDSDPEKKLWNKGWHLSFFIENSHLKRRRKK